MRILLINQFFGQDTTATGQLLSDLAEHLMLAGHSVTVISGSSRAEPNSTNGVQFRTFQIRHTEFSRRLRGRVGSYVSFLSGAFLRSLRLDAPDIVITLTTPPLLSLVGLALQTFRNARHIIWEMDVYPDVAVDLGVLKTGGVAAGFFAWLADIPRHRADTIVVLGECMRDRVLSHGISPDKLAVVHNWATDPVTEASGSRPGFDWLFTVSGPLSILYSGNFGMAHDVETIAHAMREYSTNGTSTEIEFLFGGGGSLNAWLQEFCRKNQVNSARFLPYCERDALPGRLAASHIGLVTQKKECLGSAVPSKTYAIMAAARPVLFIGPRTSTPALIIAEHDCGWQIDPGDAQGLVQLLRHLQNNRQLLVQAGNRAYKAFQKDYRRSIALSKIESLLGVAPVQSQPEPLRSAARASGLR